MGKTFSKAYYCLRADEIFSLAKSGYSCQAIANQLGLTENVVGYWLTKDGDNWTALRHRNQLYFEHKRGKVRLASALGFLQREIAESLGVTQPQISNILKESNKPWQFSPLRVRLLQPVKTITGMDLSPGLYTVNPLSREPFDELALIAVGRGILTAFVERKALVGKLAIADNKHYGSGR